VSAVDEIIAKITEAPSDEAALAIIKAATRRMRFAVADQLYVDAIGHGDVWICNAIVKEARA
jgi:hypothetical protein